MYVHIENAIKMENSLLGKNLEHFKKFLKCNFDWNQLKLSTQHKYMYMYQKM